MGLSQRMQNGSRGMLSTIYRDWWQIPRYWLDAGVSGHMHPNWSSSKPEWNASSGGRRTGIKHSDKDICTARQSVCLCDGLTAPLYTAICSVGWLIVLRGFMFAVCVCVLHLSCEIQVCLYWRDKETAPSSAILSNIVNHHLNDLVPSFLWGSVHVRARFWIIHLGCEE